MTAATRQKRARDRRKAEGLVMIRVWVPADKAEAVREAVAAIQRGEAQDRWIAMDEWGASVEVPPVTAVSFGPAMTWRAVSEEDYQIIQRLRGETQARPGQSDPAPEALARPACET